MAWTEVGGVLLSIEAGLMPGNVKVKRTGKLGEVMLGPILATMTVVLNRMVEVG